jgi:hypothetical protein
MAMSDAWWEGWKEVPLLEDPSHFTSVPTTSIFHLSHPATISDAWWEGWKNVLPIIPPVVESISTAGGIPPPLVESTSTSGGVPPPVVDSPTTGGGCYASLVPSPVLPTPPSVSVLVVEHQLIVSTDFTTPALPAVTMMDLNDDVKRFKAHPKLSILQMEYRRKKEIFTSRKRKCLTAPKASKPITSLMSPPTCLVTPSQLRLSDLPASCTSSPSPKTTYKRSRTGDSFIIVKATSPLQFSRKAVPLLPLAAPSPAPEILGSLSRDSLKRTTEAHCPVRGHDPG